MTTRARPGIGKIAVVGGAGAVGAMLTALFRADGHTVTVIDRNRTAHDDDPTVLIGDVAEPSAEIRAALAAADTVVLAVPDAVAVEAVPVLDPVMRPEALLAETLSVKSDIHRQLRERAADRPAVGINPMFAPGLGMAGRPVAAVVHREDPAVDRFLGDVSGWGARIVTLSAAEHDRVTATTQALTHAVVLAFGLALTESGFGVDTLAATAPPPHTTLLALLARVGGGVPEVYHDIQAGNPEAAAARKALAAGLARLSETVERGDEQAFADLMTAAVSPLGDRLDDYRQACAALFRQLPYLV